jgi:hypothetical protein
MLSLLVTKERGTSLKIHLHLAVTLGLVFAMVGTTAAAAPAHADANVDSYYEEDDEDMTEALLKMKTGKVKFFNETKGYQIVSDGPGKGNIAIPDDQAERAIPPDNAPEEKERGMKGGFEATRPSIRVIPENSIEFFHTTPSGKVIDVLVKVNGHDI